MEISGGVLSEETMAEPMFFQPWYSPFLPNSNLRFPQKKRHFMHTNVCGNLQLFWTFGD